MRAKSLPARQARPGVGFVAYVNSLEQLLRASTSGFVGGPARARIEQALDGEPNRELRRHYALTDLRASGTFLTGSVLATKLADQAVPQAQPGTVFCDPACGAGDLLVAAARHFPVAPDLDKTLTEWGQRLVAFDIQPLLVRATKTRLALLAVQRGATHIKSTPLVLDEFFPYIRNTDGMSPWDLPPAPVIVLVNPPFTRVKTTAPCGWASGSVSKAALFLESCLAQRKRPLSIFAILPDVLRTGSRYGKWRKMVSGVATVSKVTPIGLFDRWTDVDVFTAKLEIRTETIASVACGWAVPSPVAIGTIGDKFKICVGSVVPYRHEHTGLWFPFAHAKILPAWGKVDELSERIRSRMVTFRPPFVLIRRTSRPEDHFRAVGTIITGQRPVAVENHLLAAIPKDGTVRTCRQLLSVLRNADTNEWLNRRIRCRHLTVGAVQDVPWKPILEESLE